ncbi:hypothetical protein L21SP4_00808 [Kiritimatiella glycovorans]|uniref:DUF4469 domain-containing protein n=2 Tax=Kiritimatiella glycovorans TaxID=1307763 RepID=A0A0G3EC47_9BACT|nr:hypothetical protein L21SP4_00808 [Kiritimatiella glycovorans]
MLLGIFDTVRARSLPLRFSRLCIVTRWCSGEGSFQQRSRILCPDQEAVLAEGRNIPLRLQSPESTATNVEVFADLEFGEFGTYWVEVLLDEAMMIRFPIRILKSPAKAPHS